MASTEEIARRRPIARRVEVKEEMRHREEPADLDPFREVTRQQEEMRASALRQAGARQQEVALEIQNAQMENEAKKIRVEGMRLEREERELRQPAQSEEQGGLLGQVLGAILARADRAEEGQAALYQRFIEMMSEQKSVERREDAQVEAGSESAMGMFQARLVETKALLEMVQGFQMAGRGGEAQIPASMREAEIMLQYKKAEVEADIARARLAAEERRAEEDHQRRMKALGNEERERELRIQAERERNEKLGNVVERLGPQALAAFRQNMADSGPAAAPAEAAAAMSVPAPIRISCPSCQSIITVDANEPRVVCPNCEQVLVRGEDSQGAGGRVEGWPSPE